MRDDLARLFRSQVRTARPYVVGSSPGIVVKLNQNENPDNVPEAVRNLIGEIANRLNLNRYPSEQPLELRDAIAQYAAVDPASVLVTHGSNEFVHSLCLAFVEPGRRVLIPSPVFSLFRNSVRLFGGDLIEVEADESLDFPVGALCMAATRDRPELTIVPCPNNPTGRDLSLDQIREIVSASNGIVVVDEAYWEFTNRPSAIELLEEYDNVIVMRTLSKAFGLAGLRIGYAVARPDVIDELLKVRLPFMVSRFDAALAVEILNRPSDVRVAASKLVSAQKGIAREISVLPGVKVVPSVTNFVLFWTPLPSSDLLARLARRGVLVRDMSGYPRLEGYLRVNAGTESENSIFLEALKSALSEDV